MMFASIAQGHVDLADFLLLLAAIAFGLATLFMAITTTVSPKAQSMLVPLGLTLLAVAFFVL